MRNAMVERMTGMHLHLRQSLVVVGQRQKVGRVHGLGERNHLAAIVSLGAVVLRSTAVQQQNGGMAVENQRERESFTSHKDEKQISRQLLKNTLLCVLL